MVAWEQVKSEAAAAVRRPYLEARPGDQGSLGPTKDSNWAEQGLVRLAAERLGRSEVRT